MPRKGLTGVMLILLSGNITSPVIPFILLKAVPAISFKELGKSSDASAFSLSHPTNACAPIVSILLGSGVIVSKLVHPLNASLPILCRFIGNCTLTRDVQFSNALLRISFIFFGSSI